MHPASAGMARHCALSSPRQGETKVGAKDCPMMVGMVVGGTTCLSGTHVCVASCELQKRSLSHCAYSAPV